MSVTYRFELFDADGDNPRGIWSRDGSDRLEERQLDRAEVTGLIEAVERVYAADRPDVVAVGESLYRWLDGRTERWLQAVQAMEQPITLVVPGGERLRGLPWETLFDTGFLCVDTACPISPVRSASARASVLRGPANRPLRVLFMASSPLGVLPELNFEAEEAEILRAGLGQVEVVVEESGSLEGLASVVAGADEPFDVIHLSGHGEIATLGPRFVMEDAAGARQDASADDIARALLHHWPRLLFVSGCSTGQATDTGLVASMAEALVKAGAPAVLAWALPVGDRAATRLAASLYQSLGRGESVVVAVSDARRALFDARPPNPAWHLLRLYADRSPLPPIVTPPRTKNRARISPAQSHSLFLDKEGRIKVATRESFVGRRRDVQRLLAQLRPRDGSVTVQGAVLHGMGGLGKSSLAARLLDRIGPTHPHQAVWVGKIAPDEIKALTSKINLKPDQDHQVNQLLNHESDSLADRIRYILSGPLASTSDSCMFVFDDFENGNLEPDGTGGFQCTAEALEVLNAFGTAIQRTGSPSRVLVTSRHNFPLPKQLRFDRASVGALEGTDLLKKLTSTRHLGPLSTLDPDFLERAIAAGAGIPRLIERLDDVIDNDPDDLPTLLTKIEHAELEYREELLLTSLLSAQRSEVRRLLALATVYEIAVPLPAVHALVPEGDIRVEVESAVNAGLLQAGIHPTTNEVRYLVSSLVRPLVNQTAERLSDQDLQATQVLAAQALYKQWVADGE